MKKILLIGHFGFANRGCEAIVRGTIEIIKKTVPDSEILMMSNDPQNDEKIRIAEELPISKIITSKLEGKKRYTPEWIWQTIDRRLISKNMSFYNYLLKSEYEKVDVVVSIGGDNFTDDYGSPKQYFDCLNLARKLGKKTVIWGASIGPFREREQEWIDMLRNYDLITVREDKTKEYLLKNGLTDNVRRVSDPGFLMEPKKPQNWSKPNNEILIGLGVSDLIYKYNMSKEKYLSTNAAFSDCLIEKMGGNIVLVPHVIKAGLKDCDDYYACQEVLKRINNKEKCSILPQNLNAAEMKYCISKCSYFIGARTHSTIASLSSGVPTISIGYSSKAWGVNVDLLETDNYVLHYKNFDISSLEEKTDSLVKNRDCIVSLLNSNLRRVKDNSLKGGIYLRECIE